MPPGYITVHTMHETGLSWQELETTPADVVHKLMLYKQVRTTIETKGQLQFPDANAK